MAAAGHSLGGALASLVATDLGHLVMDNRHVMSAFSGPALFTRVARDVRACRGGERRCERHCRKCAGLAFQPRAFAGPILESKLSSQPRSRQQQRITRTDSPQAGAGAGSGRLKSGASGRGSDRDLRGSGRALTAGATSAGRPASILRREASEGVCLWDCLCVDVDVDACALGVGGSATVSSNGCQL